jgi:hypothetical protein
MGRRWIGMLSKPSKKVSRNSIGKEKTSSAASKQLETARCGRVVGYTEPSFPYFGIAGHTATMTRPALEIIAE